jgi:hypothetical protein
VEAAGRATLAGSGPADGAGFDDAAGAACDVALGCGVAFGVAFGSRNTSVGTFGRVTMVTARPGGSSVGVRSCTSPSEVVIRSCPWIGLSATTPLRLTGTEAAAI